MLYLFIGFIAVLLVHAICKQNLTNYRLERRKKCYLSVLNISASVPVVSSPINGYAIVFLFCAMSLVRN